MDEAQRARCAALAALLRASGVLSWLGLLLSAAGLWRGLPLVLLAGLVERYFSFRLRLDESLFGALAEGRIGSPESLDDALHALGLRARPTQTRTLDERIAGTRQLLVGLAVAVAAQLLLMIGELLRWVF